jgi:hypothetical protein
MIDDGRYRNVAAPFYQTRESYILQAKTAWVVLTAADAEVEDEIGLEA